MVDKKYRRHGIARKLVGIIEDFAKEAESTCQQIEDLINRFQKSKLLIQPFITFRKSKSFIPARVQSSNRIISAVVLVSGMKLPAAKELPTAEVNSSGALISMN